MKLLIFDNNGVLVLCIEDAERYIETVNPQGGMSLSAQLRTMLVKCLYAGIGSKCAPAPVPIKQPSIHADDTYLRSWLRRFVHGDTDPDAATVEVPETPNTPPLPDEIQKTNILIFDPSKKRASKASLPTRLTDDSS